jgi:hypothetical protein
MNEAAMGSREETRVSRRTMLATLAAAATGGAAGTLMPGSAVARSGSVLARPGPAPELRGVLVYRLKTRRTKSCRACKSHHRYTVFLSRFLADTNRAHVGCDCPIVAQPISKLLFRRLFPPDSDGVARLPRPRRPNGGDLRPWWSSQTELPEDRHTRKQERRA